MVERMQTLQGRRKLTRDQRQNIIIIMAFAVLLLVFGILSPYFFKASNLIAILNAAVPLGLIAIGETVCLITGQFDMSVGMVASLSGVIWTKLVAECGFPVYGAFFIGLFFGMLSGALAGLSVSRLHMPAWMATFALLEIWQGVIYIITNGEAVRMTKFKAFKFLGQGKLFGTPITMAMVILALGYILLALMLKYTKLGRELYIVGGNPEAARNVGIRIGFSQMFVFVLSGGLAGLAGLLFASRSGSGQPIIGEMYAMQGIAASVVGGTGMTGGKANLAITFIGVMIIVSLQNGLNMIAVPSFYQHIVTGVILIMSILVQTERGK